MMTLTKQTLVRANHANLKHLYSNISWYAVTKYSQHSYKTKQC